MSNQGITDRYIRVFESLIKHGIVKNQKELCDELGTYSHIIPQMKRGIRAVTVDMVTNICQKYNANAAYIFGTSEDKFLPITKPKYQSHENKHPGDCK